ncbi:MAG: hypothetical protein ACRD1K_07170 [Acidimicrobiales bacterium]
MTTATTPSLQPTTAEDLTPRAITVIAWPDPVIDNAAGSIPTASDDALIWWTPTIGPTAALMAHRFATYAADGPSLWALVDIAQTFGLGQALARVTHTLDRLDRFGIVARHGDTVAVRLMLAPLTARQRVRLPDYLANAYPG